MRVVGLLVAATLALPLSAGAVDAQQQPALDAGKENTGRISAMEGDALFGRGPYDDETWQLSDNAVLREGDEIFTEGPTFAEIEMPGGTFVRLGANTTIVVQRIHESGIEISLADGSVYVSRGNGAAPALVQTFGGAVELGGLSMARVGSDENRTQIDVKVAKGSAEMRSEKTAIAVAEGKTLVWTRTGSRTDAYGAAAQDDFDRWNRTREDRVRGTSRPAHVASGAMGAYELEGNGTWVMIDGYYAWQPTVVYAGWRPYSYGYWSWCEPYGWTWVDYYGWGYTTSHYGRWYYRHHYGWVWYPDPYWGASWVVWAAFGPNIGWAPCDFWGRPIYVYSYYSYYDYGAWCYTDSAYFYDGGGYRTRGVRTSTSRTATSRTGSGSSARAATGVGRNGNYTIRTFDQNTIRQHSPVPVRDAVRELTPRNIADAAERGVLKGVRPEARKGEFLARAVKEGGVRPEPWTDRGGRDGGLRTPGVDGERGGSRGSDSARARDGWGVGDARNDGGRGVNPFDRGGSSRSGDNPFGGRNDARSNDSSRGIDTPSRGDSSSRGSNPFGGRDSSRDAGTSSQPDRGWTPPARSNDSGSSRGSGSDSYKPPARSNDSGSSRGSGSDSYKPPARSNDTPSYSPPARSNDSRPAPSSTPKQDRPKPRSSSSDARASGDGYSYGTRDGASRKPSRSTPSYDAPSSGSGRSSYTPPSYGSSRGSSGSSSKSYGGGSSSSSSSKSYGSSSSSSSSSKSSGSSSKSSGGSSRSSSSSSSKSSGGKRR